MRSAFFVALRFTAACLSLFAATVACSKDLTRKEAERLILAKQHYPQAIQSFIDIPVGTFWTCNASSFAAKPAIIRARDEGLLRLTYTGNSRPDSVCNNKSRTRSEVHFELTPAGEALVATRSPRRLKDSPDKAYFRACELEFGGVTGITFNDTRTEAYVEYAERYARPTSWVDDTNSGKCIEGRTLPRRARFRKYDDGWRLLRQ